MSALSLNESHDPDARSWLESANREGGDFPIQNLPFGVFRGRGRAEPFRGGIAIGDQVLDLAALADSGLLAGAAAQGARAGAESTLNALMALGPHGSSALRHALFTGLLRGSPSEPKLRACLIAQVDAEHAVPAHIGDYTDFYASIHHATAVGKMMRPDNPLLPNYRWVPIGYHGRSSSIGVSGQSFPRPRGQRLPPGADQPVVGPSRRLDYELELGVFIGRGNPSGTSIPIAAAESHIFGLCLLNDWSARDLQAWEYQPLGPFLAKNFATTLSPWIVTLEALAPYRAPLARPEGAPAPLDYLSAPRVLEAGAIDIRLEAWLRTAAMRTRAAPPQRLSSTSFKHSFWTIAQLVAHHTVNGCDLRSGDLLGTGTQSGPTPAEAGSLLELSAGGKQPIAVGDEQRTFLEDGDEVILRAWCEREGAARIGFGEACGRVMPAL
ncbi:MAG TPA: fumarylacetoacetase [Steroidobacteraceae bacterium]|jgi:fumarylacetoacetase|nr:fumarylacetoacetase [Steroidobacteraceae bacterium]